VSTLRTGLVKVASVLLLASVTVMIVRGELFLPPVAGLSPMHARPANARPAVAPRVSSVKLALAAFVALLPTR
jgi:hypothetical protein